MAFDIYFSEMEILIRISNTLIIKYSNIININTNNKINVYQLPLILNYHYHIII